MKKTLAVDAIELGMYVELKGNWLTHPFARSRFIIKTENDLAKIRRHFDEVVVDLERSEPGPAKKVSVPEVCADLPASVVPDSSPAESAKEMSWEEKNTPSEDLLQALQENAPAEEKSQAIFNHSVELMDKLLANEPTAEAIKQSTEPLRSLAECVINEEDVSRTLLGITSHDYYTYTHCVNVGIKALLIARHIFGVSDQALLKELSVGFFLHDIGKSQVDPGILNKPGKLTEEEFEIMRSHPERGIEILTAADSLTESARVITLQHHEKTDGTGYPYGLKGDSIHEFSQICAMADIYDALTAERSYKKGMPVFEALSVMKNNMSDHFDPKLFKGFLNLFVSSSK